MQRVAETLQTLLAPGQRARLSPFVEATQLHVLFGEVPDDRRRAESIRAILGTERAVRTLTELAATWEAFNRRNKPFSSAQTYYGQFLRTYLAYYTSSNVPKLQVVLTELVREGALPSPSWQDRTLKVLDIGVGPGTTALAVLDFLLAWHSCCLLWSQPFPLTSVELVGIDRSPEALEFAQTVTRSFGDQVARWVTTRDVLLTGNDSERTSWVGRLWAEQICQAAAHARWETVDLTRTENLARGQQLARWANIIVASYVLRELRDARSEDNLSTVLAAAQPGTLVLLLESGGKSDSSGLMRWRRGLLRAHPEFRTVLPCGQEFSAELPECCDSCWPSRREGFLQTALYRSFVERCPSLNKCGERYDDFENELLSWTYVVLERTTHPVAPTPRPAVELKHEREVTLTSRCIGRYHGRTLIAPDPNCDPLARRCSGDTSIGLREYIKLCPAYSGISNLAFVREPGFVLPRLLHGAEVRIERAIALSLGKRGSGQWILKPNGDQTTVQVQEVIRAEPARFLPVYNDDVRDALDDIAYRLFGFPALRPFQHLILQRALTGRSVLGIAATGSGKSECFILPAMLLPGFTVVVSPLKALMQDQFEQRIRERYGLDFLCTYLNGEVPMRERDRRLRLLEQGCFKLVYVTPEQLQRDWVIESLKRAHQKVPGGFRYLAMDEAHCVSQWGHDFRPAYLNIVQRLRQHGLEPTVIALTATASPQVREDLCRELQLDQRPIEQGGDVLVDASNRPELNLIVRVVDSTERKAEEIAKQLRDLLERNRADPAKPGAAIVFMPWTGHDDSDPDPSSPRVTQFAAWLETELGSRVSIYHGKMDDDPAVSTATEDEQGQRAMSVASKPLGDVSGRARRAEQDAFIHGERDVMVATKGFGMGVDKPNIRLILHRTPPANMEAYWQEAGRAGRDGDFADVIVYFSPDSPAVGSSDYEIQEFFLQEKYVRRQDVEAMIEFLGTLQPTRAGTLYFTSDEVIEFLERPECGFEWPYFGERRRYRNESPQHAAILDCGHQYGAKCKYIDRILQALQSYRPFVDGHFVSLVDEVHQCGTELRQVSFEPANVDRIFTSNLYFGRFLREKEQRIPQLRPRFFELVKQGDLLALADLLELPVHETGALLADIRTAERERFHPDRGGRPQGLLLDYAGPFAPHRGLAAGKTTLGAWRDYAGAYKRASKSEADRRARGHGRERPILDDWFSWRELENSRGWEVTLGTAFTQPVRLKRYVRAFVEQMERRQQYDWEAYTRFLTEYIGVEQTPNRQWQARRDRLPCLRTVILGYLKTDEVTVGDSCYGCSRCVPDLRFSLDVESRSKVVARLSAQITELLERLERSPNDWPESAILHELIAAVAREFALRRRVGDYLLGWTDRLLSDMPQHRSILLVRLLAACRGWIQLPSDETLRLTERMLELDKTSHSDVVDFILFTEGEALLKTVPHLRLQRAKRREQQHRLAESVDELYAFLAVFKPANDGVNLTNDVLEARRWLARLLLHLGRLESAAEELEWLSRNEQSPSQRREALELLYDILIKLCQTKRAEHAALQRARLTPDSESGQAWYEKAGVPSWSAERVVEEVAWLHRYQRRNFRIGITSLLPVWLDLHHQVEDPDRKRDELVIALGHATPLLDDVDPLDFRWIRPHLGDIERWPASKLHSIYGQMLAKSLLSISDDERRDLSYILAAETGIARELLSELITDIVESWPSREAPHFHDLLKIVRGDAQVTARLMKSISGNHWKPTRPGTWLTVLQPSALRDLGDGERAHVLDFFLRELRTPQETAASLDLFHEYITDEHVAGVIERHLSTIVDAAESTPPELLTAVATAVCTVRSVPFDDIPIARAALRLIQHLPPPDNIRCLRGFIIRVHLDVHLLNSTGLLWDIYSTIMGTDAEQATYWIQLHETALPALSSIGTEGLFVAALTLLRAGKFTDAVDTLVDVTKTWSRHTGEHLERRLALAATTARDILHMCPSNHVTKLADTLLYTLCCQDSWANSPAEAALWFEKYFTDIADHISIETVTRLLLSGAFRNDVSREILYALRHSSDSPTHWATALLTKVDEVIGGSATHRTNDFPDFEALEFLRALVHGSPSWYCSLSGSIWWQHVQKLTGTGLSRDPELRSAVIDWLKHSHNAALVEAVLDLAPPDWPVQVVERTLQSIEEKVVVKYSIIFCNCTNIKLLRRLAQRMVTDQSEYMTENRDRDSSE